MVGIVAAYCNNMETKVAYIPLACVDVEYRGAAYCYRINE